MTSSGFHFEVLNQGRSADFSLQPLRNPPTAATKAPVRRAFDRCCGLKSSSLPTSLYLFHMTLTICCLGQKPRRGGLFIATDVSIPFFLFFGGAAFAKRIAARVPASNRVLRT